MEISKLFVKCVQVRAGSEAVLVSSRLVLWKYEWGSDEEMDWFGRHNVTGKKVVMLVIWRF